MFSEYIFWFAAATFVYIYAGYPLLAWALALAFKKSVRKARVEPTVTVVIAAYNEERDIENKIANVLALNYPHGKLNVIVASDASSDKTDALVESYPAPNV